MRTTKGGCFLHFQTLSPQTQKEGVRRGQKASSLGKHRLIPKRIGMIAFIAFAITTALTISIEQAEAARGGVDGGFGGSVLGNYIHDALTGNRVQVNPPMNGQITATPKVEAYGGYRFWSSINGYSHGGLRYDKDRKRGRGYNDDKWTEYFNVDYGEVIDNPDYDPEAELGIGLNSNKYMLHMHGEFNDHGDEYKSTGQMEKEYSTAKKGYVYDDDGNKYIDFSKKGRWVYVGDSELIKCSHRLVNEVTVGDNRLAKNQKYRVQLRWQLERLTWSKDEEDFVHNGFLPWETEDHNLLATRSSRKIVKILKKNTRIYELKEKGSSQLYRKGRAVKPWTAKNYILWEREHYDELKEQRKGN